MTTQTEQSKRFLTPMGKRLPWYRRLRIAPFLVLAIIGVLLCYPATLIIRGFVVAAYIKDGQRDMETGKWNTARAKFNSAMDWSLQNEQAFDERWGLALQSGDVDTAINDFSAVIAAHPSRYMGYCYRADAYREIDKIQEAISDYHACLDREPSRIWKLSAENILSVIEK